MSGTNDNVANVLWNELGLGELLTEIEGIQNTQVMPDVTLNKLKKNDPLQKRKAVIKSSTFNVLMNRYNVRLVSDPAPIGIKTLKRLADPLSKHIPPEKVGPTWTTKKYVTKDINHLKSSSNKKKFNLDMLPTNRNVQKPKPSGTFFLTETDDHHNNNNDMVAPGLDMGMDLLQKLDQRPIRHLINVPNNKRRPNNIPINNPKSNNIYANKSRISNNLNNLNNRRNEIKSANNNKRVPQKYNDKLHNDPKRNKSAPPQLTRRERLNAVRPDRTTKMFTNKSENKHLPAIINSNNNNTNRMKPKVGNWVMENSVDKLINNDDSNNENILCNNKKSNNNREDASWSKTVLKLRGQNKRAEAEVMLNFIGLNKSPKKMAPEAFALNSPKDKKKVQYSNYSEPVVEPYPKMTRRKKDSIENQSNSKINREINNNSRGSNRGSSRSRRQSLQDTIEEEEDEEDSNYEEDGNNEEEYKDNKYYNSNPSRKPNITSSSNLKPSILKHEEKVDISTKKYSRYENSDRDNGHYPQQTIVTKKDLMRSRLPSIQKDNADAKYNMSEQGDKYRSEYQYYGGGDNPRPDSDSQASSTAAVAAASSKINAYNKDKDKGTLVSEAVTGAMKQTTDLIEQKRQSGRPQSQPSLAAQLASHARRITGQLAAAQRYAEDYRKLAVDGGYVYEDRDELPAAFSSASGMAASSSFSSSSKGTAAAGYAGSTNSNLVNKAGVTMTTDINS